MTRPWGRCLSAERFKEQLSSTAEVKSLLAVAERQLEDASVAGVSADGRFAWAYEAALQLATVVIRASGRRLPARPGHHRSTFKEVPRLLGDEVEATARYFETCRRKRNMLTYHSAGVVTADQADELVREVRAFREAVVGWLAREHPGLLGDPRGPAT